MILVWLFNAVKLIESDENAMSELFSPAVERSRKIIRDVMCGEYQIYALLRVWKGTICVDALSSGIYAECMCHYMHRCAVKWNICGT